MIIMSGKSVTTSLVPINRVVIVGASLAGLRAAEAPSRSDRRMV
jgi:hypothetical protein